MSNDEGQSTGRERQTQVRRLSRRSLVRAGSGIALGAAISPLSQQTAQARAASGRARTLILASHPYVARVQVVMAWCELRQDFRLFRTDRLTSISFLDERYPARPAALRRQWLATVREGPSAQ